MVKRGEILLNVLKSYKDYNPPDGEEQFLREVFDTTSEDLVTVCKPVPYYKLLIIQKAIFSVLHDWEIKTRTRIKDDSSGPIEYVTFDIGYGIKEDAIKEGSIVFAGPGDQRLVVKIETNYYEHIEAAAPEVFLTCERENKTWMEDLWIRIDEWMVRKN